ncbi:ABC transporter permease [Leucobacter celer]|uniref:ABC transporter permease n=1 Tax=Leucobacter celer TaxID=668625 RepID=UPI0006A79EF0|nr:ABC transporter permease [Leucobacter celer]
MKAAVSRIATGLSAIVGASLLAFFLLRVAPGDPVALVLGPFATDEAKAALREQMGLDLPVWTQYIRYIGGIFRGDWGYSYTLGVEVRTLFADRLPASIELALAASLFAVVFAGLTAVLQVMSRRRWVQRTIDAVNLVGLSLPQFWLALLLIVGFAEVLGWLPGSSGRLSTGVLEPPHVTGLFSVDAILAGDWTAFADATAHLVLPAIALGLYSMAFLSRVFAANLRVAAGRPFVDIAIARGLTRRHAILRHAAPNAAITSLTAAGILVGLLMTGGVLVEGIFSWPGIGASVTSGIQSQDFSTVQAYVLFSAVVFVIINLAIELIILRIDPRVRDSAALQTTTSSKDAL